MSIAAASEERAARRAVERPAGSPTLGRFLLDQLHEAGVDTVFGIPGDFILRLFQVIEEDPRLASVGNTPPSSE